MPVYWISLPQLDRVVNAGRSLNLCSPAHISLRMSPVQILTFM